MTEPQAAPKKRTARKKASRTVNRPDVPAVPQGLRPPRILDRCRKQPDGSRTDMTVAEVVAFKIEQGLRPEAAAKFATVLPVTLRGWLDRGMTELAAMENENRDDPAEGEAPYVWLLSMVMDATAEWEDTLRRRMEKATAKDWRGQLAWAKIVDPDTFGDKSSRVEVTGAGGGPIQTANIPSMAEVGMIMAQLPKPPDA